MLATLGVLAAGAAGAVGYNTSLKSKYDAAVARREREGRSRTAPLKGFEPFDRPIKETSIDNGDLLQFTDSLGLKLCVYNWAVPNGKTTKGVLVLFHGLDGNCECEYLLRPGFHYKGSWVEHFNEQGYDCWGFDYMSMGRSESIAAGGMRSMVYSEEDYVDEAQQFITLVKERFPKLPIYMMGQSMGGHIGLRVCQRLGDTVKSATFLSPAVMNERLLAEPSNKILLPLMDVASVIAPWLPVGAKVRHARPEIAQECEEVGLPLINTGMMRVRYGSEMLASNKIIIADKDKLVTPTLFIHGRHDIFCDFEGSELFVNNNPDRHRLLEVDEKFGHDIVNSLESLPIAKQVGAWFGQHS